MPRPDRLRAVPDLLPREPAERRAVARGQDEDGADAGVLSVEDAFRRYAGELQALAHRLVGSASDADDVIQDVFLDAYHGLRRVRDPAAVRRWLKTVTVRRCWRRLRARRARRVVGLESVMDYAELSHPGASPEVKAQVTSVYRCLERLPAGVHLAWCFRYIEGENLDRVAELLGCSRATAHRRVVRAQTFLEAELGHV